MQKVELDPQLNAVKTEIRKPFYAASVVLGWPFKDKGLGFNRQIINTCLDNNADLIVHLVEEHRTYFVKFANLKHFMEKYPWLYRVKNGTELAVIAFSYFSIYEEPKNAF